MRRRRAEMRSEAGVPVVWSGGAAARSVDEGNEDVSAPGLWSMSSVCPVRAGDGAGGRRMVMRRRSRRMRVERCVSRVIGKCGEDEAGVVM
mgnify:CR=1 FL=1